MAAYAAGTTYKGCYISPVTSPELSRDSRWRPVRLLLESMNSEIAAVYAAHGVQGVPPRFSLVLIRLAALGPLTIRALAKEVEVTHSAMSQTVAAMRRDGLVASAPGEDARTRLITLTDRGRELVPFLEAEWWATEAAVAELEAEVPYPLSQVVADLSAALERRPFRERVAAHLDETR